MADADPGAFQQLDPAVEQRIQQSQNDILTNIDTLLTSRFAMFEQRISSSQRDISDSQLSKIQQNILSNDSYTFKRKGNEEQFKANVRVIDKLREADSHLTDSLSQNTAESTVLAKARVSEGIDILKHRQKLIKLADSSELGWKVVQEYESHPLADDSDDEKRMYRATARATRKMKQDRARFQRRPRPYSIQSSIVNSTPANQSITTQPMSKRSMLFVWSIRSLAGRLSKTDGGVDRQK